MNIATYIHRAFGSVNRELQIDVRFLNFKPQTAVRGWLLLKQGMGNRGKESGNGEWGMRNGKTRNTKRGNL